MTENETFSAFEGLAVSLAGRCWAQWARTLSARGVDRDDLLQEGRTVLLKILPKLNDPTYTVEQRRAFITKSVRGKLLNFIKAALRNGDTRDRADPPLPDRDGLIDLQAALQSLDEQTRMMVIARYGGATYAAIAKQHGVAAAAATRIVKGGLATLKRRMHAEDF